MESMPGLSIKLGGYILKAPCNGWMAWYYIDEVTGNREPIDLLRKKTRKDMQLVGILQNRLNGVEL